MSVHYTAQDAYRAFERLAEATGARIADPAWKIPDKRRLGAWILDHNSTYGGYVVRAYAEDSHHADGRPQTYTAQSCPLGESRRPAREFVYTCNFAIRVLGERKPRRARKATTS